KSFCTTAALHVEKAVPTPVVAANATGKIIGNHIGTSGHQGSATKVGANSDGLQIDDDGQGSFTVLIKNNDIHGFDEYGMSLFAIEGSAALNATIVGNTIDTPNANDPVAGIDFTIASATTDSNLAQLHIGDVFGTTAADKHSISGAPGTTAIGQANDILCNGQATTNGQVNLPGYTGSASDTAAVTTYLSSHNTLADTPFVTFNVLANNFHNTSPAGSEVPQPKSLSFSPASPLTAATVGVSYTPVNITASGGNGTYNYSIITGALPSGMTLNTSSGQLSGTPTAGGTFTFTVRATDTSVDHITGTQAYSLTVNPPAAGQITFSPGLTLTATSVGAVYSQTITASGATSPYTYSLA